MERKIGERFEIIGYTLIVLKHDYDCEGCFFYEHDLECHRKEIMDITGGCFGEGNPGVIFKEVEE